MKKTKQLFACLALMTLCLGTAHADYALNLMQGVTRISNDVYDLHMLILWICVFIGAGVFGVMFYSIFHHRKSKGHQAAQFHENTTVEIIWTIIPTLILISMAVPATKSMLEMDDIKDSQMTIKVIGWQWKWEYDYLDNGIHFFSNLDEASNKARQVNSGVDPRSVPNYLLNVDKPLVVPVKTKIKFQFTAQDVIHSWWVPDLGWKKDAIPGYINEAWTSVDTPGTYRGQCTELCGKDHGFMPIVVIAMEKPEYDEWVKQTLEQQKKANNVSEQSHEQLVSAGAEIYAKNCSTCHMPGGEGISGTFPAITGSAIVSGDIKAQADFIINGKGAMPAFGKMLNANELAQVITFTRNALGNSKGDHIQPTEVQALLSHGTASSAKSEEKPAVKADVAKVDANAKLSTDELLAKGKKIYDSSCASCHQADGAGLPGTFPALTASKIVTGDVKKQVELMVKGKGMMPAFGNLDPVDFAAVLTYTRNALGNKVGDSIQAAEVKSFYDKLK